MQYFQSKPSKEVPKTLSNYYRHRFYLIVVCELCEMFEGNEVSGFEAVKVIDEGRVV